MGNKRECVWQDLGNSTVLKEVVGACVYRSAVGEGVFTCTHFGSGGGPSQQQKCPDPTIMAKIHEQVARVAQERKASHKNR
ncbi:hypothetical protein KBB12_02200 [Candidatus Woesebacteria bacterium]|nr:hypothetical protein [Candidatus Woesebacteria bacterium]